jgi:cytochrome c-type biogenesis protein CcsB
VTAVPINEGLANLSHAAFIVTVMAYAVAVLAFAGDFAFGREVLGQLRPAREPATDRVTVGVTAGGPPAGTGGDASGPGGDTAGPGGDTAGPGAGSPGAPAPAGATRPGTADGRAMGSWVRVALAFTLLGLAAHLLGVVSRGLAVHRVPWGDMYEFVTTVTCVAVAVFVWFMIRYRAYRLGLFVLGPVVVLLGIAETLIYTPAGQLPPALQSYWLAIHVTSITLATGAFVVAALLAVSYLLADRHERRAATGLPARGEAIFRLLPAPKLIDRLAYRIVLFGFPLWTFGIIAGAIWADEAWGRYWGWDPTETWAFITWVVYAGYLHARATAGWRGRRAAYIMLIGFGCLLFNTVVVSLLIKGLHSYAGLS